MSMTKAFYIVEVRKDWYRLHITSTHYCLGACDRLQSLLNTVIRLTKKYRNEDRLLKGLSKMEDCGQVNDSSLIMYRGDYTNLHAKYDGVVESAVREALEEVKFDTPFHRAMQRASARRTLITTPTSDDSHKEVETTLKPKVRKPCFKKVRIK